MLPPSPQLIQDNRNDLRVFSIVPGTELPPRYPSIDERIYSTVGWIKISVDNDIIVFELLP